MEGARRVLIVVDQGCIGQKQYKELIAQLQLRDLDVIGLLCRRFDSKPVELWSLDNLAPVEMEEIRMLLEKAVR